MPRKRAENLTVQQEQFVRMEANGYLYPDIIKAIWDLTREDDEKEYHAKESMLSRWRKHPKYVEVWKDEVKKHDFKDFIKARNTLRRSMDADDKWLAMQSAVNVMNTTGKRIYADEENSVRVEVVGMPDLGTPDQPE